MIRLALNDKAMELDVPPDMPLLWAIRDHANLTGAKFGCGVSLCGACTVHLDGQPVRSCTTPVVAAEGRRITPIEGIGATPEGQALQAAWKEIEVVQCGFRQPGAAALLRANRNPSLEEIDAAMSGNLCRCNTYPRIRAGIQTVAKKLG